MVYCINCRFYKKHKVKNKIKNLCFYPYKKASIKEVKNYIGDKKKVRYLSEEIYNNIIATLSKSYSVEFSQKILEGMGENFYIEGCLFNEKGNCSFYKKNILGLF